MHVTNEYKADLPISMNCLASCIPGTSNQNLVY